MTTPVTSPLFRDLVEGRIRSLEVVDWPDPVVAAVGFEAESEYVEWFWLPVLGPTATWLLRRLSRTVRQSATEVDSVVPVDCSALAGSLGVGWEPGRPNPFVRALQRLEMFGLVRPTSSGLAVRTVVPPIASQQIRRLPDHLRREHPAWVSALRTAA
jgi:hypothetical protein